MKFGMFFLGEYLGITLISRADRDALLRRLARAVAAAAASGSCSRRCVLIGLFILVRGVAAPAALRPADGLGWKVMLPLALLNLLVTGRRRAGRELMR